MATRRLSDSEESSNADSTLSQILEECASMEGDFGEIFPQDSTSQLDLDPAEQVARIAFSLYQEAVAFESEMKQTQPEIQSAFPVLPPSSGVWLAEADYASPYLVGEESTPQQHDAARDNQRLSSGPTTSEHQPTDRLREVLASSAHPPEKASQPAYLGLPSDLHDPSRSSLLQHGARLHSGPAGGAHDVGAFPQGAPSLPQDAGRRRSGLKRRNAPSKGVHPELDPDSWLDEIEEIDSAPKRVRRRKFPPSSRQSSDLKEAGSRAARKDPTAEQPDAGQSPSTVPGRGAEEVSSAAARPETSAGTLQAVGTREHPYVHMPALEEGVVRPPIRLSSSSFVQGNGLALIDVLLSFRRLFMKDALNQVDVNLLGGNVEELAIASASRARATKRMANPLHGVLTIGRQFLIFDAMVSALHILGIAPASCTWWKAFIECFDTNFRYPNRRGRWRDSGRVITDLANRMLDAIFIYKRGKRPAPEEIIDIKRVLFFSPYTHIRFRASIWDPWRSDCAAFEGKHPQFSS
ncbi:hypothetical protein EPH_0006410 [Eimeria praecox]|uniref:Uncharacterized protein n=1 Tax=Eimeria praecox TaxID=51316 RepID=U6GB60_9EIME|nr:hypothetical protein EPH_0006410 [Eimeria praecox]